MLGPIYARLLILDLDSYRRRSEAERWEALRRMTVEESIAIGEALLTSEAMSLARFDRESTCRSLAIALGIGRRRRSRARADGA